MEGQKSMIFGLNSDTNAAGTQPGTIVYADGEVPAQFRKVLRGVSLGAADTV